MLQHETQSLLEQLAKCIDDVEHANFHAPILMHQQRVLLQRENDVAVDAEHSDEKYADAQEMRSYDASAFVPRELNDVAQTKALVKINSIVRSALNGKTISTAQLEAVLSPAQFAEYTSSLTQITHLTEALYGDGMPEQLKAYNLRLNAADFAWNKYESMQGKAGVGLRRYKHGTLEKAAYTAETLYERALEELEAVFACAERGDWGAHVRNQIVVWMDREVDFDKGSERTVGIDAVSIPRVRGSKSHNAQDSGLPKLSKRLKKQYCAQLALLEAAYNIAFTPLLEAEPDTEMLRARIKMRAMSMRNINTEKD